MEKISNSKVFIEIEYDDGSSFSFDVISHSEKEIAILADIMRITRGTLMASNGNKGTAYNEEGFIICSYVR